MAISCLDNMERKGLTPNVISFSAAIAACHKQPKIAMELLTRMQKCGVKPNIITINNSLATCSPQDWTIAVRMLNMVYDEGLTPNSLTFTALNNSFGDTVTPFYLLADYRPHHGMYPVAFPTDIPQPPAPMEPMRT